MQRRLLPALILFVLACPSEPTDVDPDATTSSDSTTILAPDPTTDADPDAATTSDTTTSTDLTYCGDQHCDVEEDALTCPDDCNVCGDAVVFGAEVCDNGRNDDPFYALSPAPEACTPDCQAVAFCGDNIRNGSEDCDAGGVQTADCEADCRAPACGDHVLNIPVGEACDDANLVVGDGCAPDCVAERRVFVTSFTYYAEFHPDYDNPDDLHGIPLADARCNALARAAGLPGNYKAWLADFTTHPAARFDTSFTGYYRLVSDHAPIVARSWHDLTDGELLHPINVDEHGALNPGFVWTNTLTNGLLASSDHCMNWTKLQWVNELRTIIGYAGATDLAWTTLDEFPLCMFSNHLYCFEDP